MAAVEITIEQRVDHGALLSSRVRPDGTLLAEGYPVREGVLIYRRGGTTIRELVTEQTLADSAHGLARLPVTLEHPTEGGVVVPVTPQNVQRYQVGDTDGNVVVEEGGFVRVQFAVRRADALAAVRGGMRELSALYDAGIDPTPGVHPIHGPYDAVQVSRSYNSIALTERGRAGRGARLRADGAELVDTIRRADSAATHHEAPMHQRWLPILLSLGLTARYDSDDAAAAAVDAELRKRADSGATALQTLTAERDRERARADAAEATATRLQAAETARADTADRAELEATATALGIDPAKHADNKALRRAVAAAYLGSEPRADESDDYLRGLAHQAKARRGEGRTAGNAAWNGTGEAPPDTRADSAERKHRPSARERYLAAIGLAPKAS